MTFQGALVEWQGVRFAVVAVKEYVIHNSLEADKIILAFQSVFPGVPIVLMAQDSLGNPHYYGRADLARFLSEIPMSAIPWKEHTVF